MQKDNPKMADKKTFNSLIVKHEGMDERFRNFYKNFPSKKLDASEEVYVLPRAEKDLPKIFSFQNTARKIQDWIEDTQTQGLIVIKNGVIRYENYFRGHSDDQLHISFSTAKSFTSAMVGIAIDEGYIQSVYDPVDKYVPSLKDSGYEGASIKNVLQMSSGVNFTEDYAHPDIPYGIDDFMDAWLYGNMDEHVATLPKYNKAGKFNVYRSTDTHVLGMVVRKATDRDFTEYMTEKLWKKMGTEKEAYWCCDPAGNEGVMGGLNATLRDYARFGLLFLNEGRNYQGEQIISQKWIKDSYTPDGPHLMPGKDNPLSPLEPFGYGYQWWLPELPEEDYCAMGIFGQYIYINRKYKVVIAKYSACRNFEKKSDQVDAEALTAFQFLAANV